MEVIDAVVDAQNYTITVPLDKSTLATKLRNGAIIRASHPNLPDPYYLAYFLFPAMVMKTLLSPDSDYVEIILFTFGDDGLTGFTISETTNDSVVFARMNQ